MPAPLRLYWRDIDESTKNKYPTAKECYCDGKFDFHRFLRWMKAHRRSYIELSWENKKISMQELNTWYENNGELSGLKLGRLLEEKVAYLTLKIKEKEGLLELLNVELRNRKNISDIYIKSVVSG